MDVASGVAGLVGLAALSAQSVTKIISIVKATKGISRNLQGHLHWLAQLAQVLNDIQQLCPEVPTYEAAIDLGPLRSCLEDCLNAVQHLTKYIEARFTSLEHAEGFARHVSKLKAVLASKDVTQQVEHIRRIQDTLNLCYTSMLRYGFLHSLQITADQWLA